MKVNRRKTLGILAAVAAGVSTAAPQAPPPASAGDSDARLRSAREGFQSSAQRIAAVKLPQATEPAFQFRA